MSQPPSRMIPRGAAPLTIVIVVAAVLLALVVTVQALSAYKRSTAREGWSEVFGSWEDVLRRYPVTEANASALELERLAGDLGIDIAPRASDRRDSLTEEQRSALSKETAASFFVYVKEQTERARLGELDAPPADVQAYMAAHEDDLRALSRHLNRGDVAVWHSDLSQAEEAPLPNLLGHIRLQKNLGGGALARLQAGDRDGALADVEAAWNLSKSLRDSPILINQLILIAGTRMQLGVLRQIPDVEPLWIERMREHDFRESFLTAMKFEGWFWLYYSGPELGTGDLPVWQRVTTPLTRPYTQLCLADLSDAWRERMLNLEEVDALCDRDLASYGADLDIQLPRWNKIGEMYYPNLVGAISRLARLELDLELTGLLIEADAVRRANGGVWPAGYEAIRDSVACPDDQWNFSLANEELEIALSRDVRWEGQKGAILPTRAIRPQ